MIDLVSAYESELDQAFGGESREERLKHFARAMRIRAEKTARDQVAANDTPLLHALRGQITILYEQSDWAVRALESDKDKAKSESEEGHP